MISLIKYLIFGHLHKWKILKTDNIWGDPEGTYPRGILLLQECESCGKLKTYRHGT